MLGNSPCRDCKERVQGCHASCKKFAEWKAEQLEVLGKMKKARLDNIRLAGAEGRHNRWLKGRV